MHRKKHPERIILFAVLLLALVLLVVIRIIRSDKGVSDTAPAASDPPSVPVTEGVPAETKTAGATQIPGTPAPTPEPTPEPEPEYYTISMIGDCTLSATKDKVGWGIGYQSVIGGDYTYPFANTVSFFENDDLTIANLECDLTDNYYPDPIEQFCFKSGSDYAQILSTGGVDFVTLANNHVMDYGEPAYRDTKAALDAVGVFYAGEDEYYIFETEGGLKVGIYCLYNQLTYNAYSILSTTARENLLAASRTKLDNGYKALKDAGAEFLITCLHMGREGYYEPTDTQVELCHYAVDAGFQTVYCTHAHRLQPVEDYNGALILLNMGNWSFGGHTNPGNGTDPAAFDTIIAQISVKRVGSVATLEGWNFIPCSISSRSDINNYQPTPYEEGSAGWERTMSILDGAYAGANYITDYSGILAAMNG